MGYTAGRRAETAATSKAESRAPGSTLSALLAALALTAGVSHAQPVAPDFSTCVTGLKQAAVDAGISVQTANDVLDRVERVDRVIELDRRQPEFTQTFTQYYGRRVTDTRISKGRELLVTHRELLDGILQRTGVPPHYLLAFWGLETNFGGYLGKMAVPDSLATLACDARRSGFFTTELIAALRIIDAGDVSVERMQGSWAGAVGHVQFMPTTFLRYAVDGDGDGTRDLWNSVPDAMASAANFLASSGWTPGLRWGREVLLPARFDYALATRARPEPLRNWSRMGVTDAFGDPLPGLSLPAAILAPSGAGGPAFVTYDNFEVIMRWNRSEFYAISVGRLADRIAGAGSLARPLPEATPLSRELVMRLQESLKLLGYDPGGVDGSFGGNTRKAVRAFQQAHNLTADGYPSRALLDAVEAARPAL